MRVEPHQVYLLHRRKYRETSAIVELLSATHGRLSCVMKGVYGSKKKSRKPTPEPFQKLEAGWIGRSEMPTVTSYDLVSGRQQLLGDALYCGMYINELIVRLVNRGEPNDALFELYERTITELANPNLEVQLILRCFEKQLLENCGYGLLLDCDADTGAPVDADMSYFYEIEHGPVVNQSTAGEKRIRGATLLKFANEELLDADELRETKHLMRQVLNFYLGDKPLLSRSLFDQQSK